MTGEGDVEKQKQSSSLSLRSFVDDETLFVRDYLKKEGKKNLSLNR